MIREFRSLFLSVAVCLFVAVVHAQAPIDIGNRLELFVDRFLIETMQGTELRLHHPQPAETVIRFDESWEGEFVGYCTVIKDSDIYRLYYRGYPEQTKKQVTCYAESRDGTTFTKPKLGLYEAAGTKDNNIILADADPVTHNFSPFIDTKPGVSRSERYKALGGSNESGLICYVSGDGIHWRKLRDEPLISKGAFDSQNVAFWSESEECYICYFRTWTGGEFDGFRTISRTTSKDFLAWSQPEEMHYGDTPHEHLYTNQTQPYYRALHIYLAFPMRFMPGRQVLTDEQARSIGVVGDYKKDCAEVVFMSSRGGNRYDRTFMEGFIRPGLDPGNWASRAGMAVLGIIPTGPSELSLYKQAHYAQPTGHLVRYTIRTDGFVSVNAPYSGGEFVMRPLIFDGSELVINFSTSAAGSIKVEIQDIHGNPVPEYSMENATETIGDEIERTVSWKNGANVRPLAGKPVRLRFVMKDADLYSLRFR